MIRKAVVRLVVSLLILVVFLSLQLGAQAGRRLWVFSESGEVTEYNTATFEPIHTAKIPVEAVRSGSLAMNGKGQILANLDAGPSAGKAWLWNGQAAMSIDRGVVRRSVPGVANNTVVEGSPRCALSADGRRIYWFENEFTRVQRAEDGVDVSVRTNFLAWHIDLETGGRMQAANSSFASCKCGTGVCSETCPEADFWIPDNGVDDFFIVTNWVPGQLGATYQSSFLYRKSDGKWAPRKLPEVVEHVEDAAQSGATIVYSLPDAGCCGWENESNDQTLALKNGKTIVLFDERERYQNPDYDVSFFTLNAKLSPDAASAAMTLSSSARPESEIRLSDAGRADARELTRIRQAMADLPAVEILRLEDPPRRSRLIPHATLVGWLNGNEILAVQNGVLVAFDVATGAQRKSAIKVPKESLIFVR